MSNTLPLNGRILGEFCCSGSWCEHMYCKPGLASDENLQSMEQRLIPNAQKLENGLQVTLTSSGAIKSLKLSKSSGSGKSVWQVLGRFSSFISAGKKEWEPYWHSLPLLLIWLNTVTNRLQMWLSKHGISGDWNVPGGRTTLWLDFTKHHPQTGDTTEIFPQCQALSE